MIYKCLIVEDQKGALENLKLSLLAHPELSIVGTASNIAETLTQNLIHQPQLIFLDVELGEESGFEILQKIRLNHLDLPLFIMTTGHAHYAKTAVNQDVLYFLDKPIDPDELIIAINKFKNKVLTLHKQLTIKNSEGHFFLNLDDIRYIKSDNNCCTLHLTNGESMFVTKTLKEIEKNLPQPFLRVHKSYIVNLEYVYMMNTTKKSLMVKSKKDTNKKCDLNEISISDQYLEKLKNKLLAFRLG